LSSIPLSNNNKHRSGFTLIEVLIASAILAIMIGIASQMFSSGLQTKREQDLQLALQQNLRAAMHLITQDLRSAGWLQVWNQNTAGCAVAGAACSDANRIAIISVDGTNSAISSSPASIFTNIIQTNVCDARSFAVNDLALLYNGSQNVNNSDPYALLTITKKTAAADYTKICSSTAPVNQDTLEHTGTAISGTWAAGAYLLRAQVANYSVQTDPIDTSLSVLFRRTGIGTTAGPGSGTVAFNVTNLTISYGIPTASATTTAPLVFYSDLAAAVTALGSTKYSAVPNDNKLYIGTQISAVRVIMTGQTSDPMPSNNQKASLTLTETVNLRR
jgi:prepilin-type N-terminal cleavage/methylation domain-containing protein